MLEQEIRVVAKYQALEYRHRGYFLLPGPRGTVLCWPSAKKPQPERSVDPGSSVVQAVSDVTGISVQSLVGPSRSAAASRPRQIAMYVLREHYSLSLVRTAAALGRTDHTTASYAQRSISRLLKIDAGVRKIYLAVMDRLSSDEETAA